MKKSLILVSMFLIILLGCKSDVLKIKGENIEAEISPADGNTIKDIVTVKVVKLPKNTGAVSFTMMPLNMKEKIGELKTGPDPKSPEEITETMEKFEKIIKEGTTASGWDDDGTDGWSFTTDTKNLENGVYFISILTWSAETFQKMPESMPEPTSTTEAEIIVQN